MVGNRDFSFTPKMEAPVNDMALTAMHYMSLAHKINSLEQLITFEYKIIDVFHESRILTDFYRKLDELGYYEKFNTHVYGFTTIEYKLLHKIKIGITELNQKGLRKSYHRLNGQLEINTFCPGYLILNN